MPGDGGVGLHLQEKGQKPKLQGIVDLLVVFEDNLSPVRFSTTLLPKWATNTHLLYHR
jgi:hypothetical protein